MKELRGLPNDMQENLIWEQGLRLFAMTNLSEDNPFRPLIEEQSRNALEDLRGALAEKDTE